MGSCAQVVRSLVMVEHFAECVGGPHSIDEETEGKAVSWGWICRTTIVIRAPANFLPIRLSIKTVTHQHHRTPRIAALPHNHYCPVDM